MQREIIGDKARRAAHMERPQRTLGSEATVFVMQTPAQAVCQRMVGML